MGAPSKISTVDVLQLPPANPTDYIQSLRGMLPDLDWATVDSILWESSALPQNPRKRVAGPQAQRGERLAEAAKQAENSATASTRANTSASCDSDEPDSKRQRMDGRRG